MRQWGAGVVLLLAACTSKSLIPCTEQATCDPYGAVCLDGFCHNPREENLDLANLDFATPLSCVDNSPCSGTSPICDTTNHECRACMIGECPAGTPRCLTSGACVECTTVNDCASKQQVCDTATHTCRACTAHAECASGICDAGTCAAESDITYVDNNNCSPAMGTKLNPFCNFVSALTKSTPYILVAGSGTPYVGFEVPSTRTADLYILGPGRSASPTAKIIADPSGTSHPSIWAHPGSFAKLTLEGLEVTANPAVTTPTLALVYSGPSTGSNTDVMIRACDLHDGLSYGVETVGGTTTIVDSVIAANPQFGVAVLGSVDIDRTLIRANLWGVSVSDHFNIENTIIADSTDGAGLSIGMTASGSFRFNTVVNNHRVSGGYPGGAVSTNSAAQTLSDNIFFGNTALSGSQFVGTFTLADTVTGTDNAAGAIQMTPTFVSATDYHLKKNDTANSACCVDRATTGPAVDYDNTPRPIGGGFDVGAHEVQ